jgi:hypothetical protein
MGENLIRDLPYWSHRVRSNSHFYVIKFSYYWLKLLILYTIHRFNNLQVVLSLLVFLYRHFDWCEVFLVAYINVIEQWALTW